MHRARGNVRARDCSTGDIRRLHRVTPQLRAADRAAGNLAAGDRIRGNGIGGDGAIGEVTGRREALVGGEKLGAVGSVIEPDAQADVGIAPDAGGERGHVRDGGIAEQDGVEALRHGERDGVGRLGAVHARTVVAPIRGGAGGVDEGELKRARAVEVDRGIAHGHATLVIDQRRHLRESHSGEKAADPEDRGQKGGVVFVHGGLAE